VTSFAPGATIGMLGGGQLARMMAIEARRMGYRVLVLDSEANCPAGQVADGVVVGALDDVEAAKRLAAQCDVVTLDTEHVPAQLLRELEALTLVRPSPSVLATVQDRKEQRQFLTELGVPQPRHAFVDDLASLRSAVSLVGLPAVLKTRRSGYDGKGQVRLEQARDLEQALDTIAQAPAVLEEFVPFEREISVVLARDVRGMTASYPVAENEHRRHILHLTRAPARVSPAVHAEAEAIAVRIAAALEHVGVIAIEMFVTREDGLLVNEIAPRTHNSGHYTLGGCATSQFEQHVRAVCGLALGDPRAAGPAVMLNLLGDLWRNGAPRFEAVLSEPRAHLHLYGKERAPLGRKMGHVLFFGAEGSELVTLAETLFATLGGNGEV
jgi:5-(carboxyamino)imidazole ribonucleotide synthase